jgi:hypothetical protein
VPRLLANGARHVGVGTDVVHVLSVVGTLEV